MYFWRGEQDLLRQVVDPIEENVIRYEEQYRYFKKLYPAIKEVFGER